MVASADSKKSASSAKERFLQIYANLPLNLRKEIILILPGKLDQPMSWEAAYVEVVNNTEQSKIILKKLEELKII